VHHVPIVQRPSLAIHRLGRLRLIPPRRPRSFDRRSKAIG
jgi:hypothetical protein